MKKAHSSHGSLFIGWYFPITELKVKFTTWDQIIDTLFVNVIKTLLYDLC